MRWTTPSCALIQSKFEVLHVGWYVVFEYEVPHDVLPSVIFPPNVHVCICCRNRVTAGRGGHYVVHDPETLLG